METTSSPLSSEEGKATLRGETMASDDGIVRVASDVVTSPTRSLSSRSSTSVVQRCVSVTRVTSAAAMEDPQRQTDLLHLTHYKCAFVQLVREQIQRFDSSWEHWHAQVAGQSYGDNPQPYRNSRRGHLSPDFQDYRYYVSTNQEYNHHSSAIYSDLTGTENSSWQVTHCCPHRYEAYCNMRRNQFHNSSLLSHNNENCIPYSGAVNGLIYPPVHESPCVCNCGIPQMNQCAYEMCHFVNEKEHIIQESNIPSASWNEHPLYFPHILTDVEHQFDNWNNLPGLGNVQEKKEISIDVEEDHKINENILQPQVESIYVGSIPSQIENYLEWRNDTISNREYSTHNKKDVGENLASYDTSNIEPLNDRNVCPGMDKLKSSDTCGSSCPLNIDTKYEPNSNSESVECSHHSSKNASPIGTGSSLRCQQNQEIHKDLLIKKSFSEARGKISQNEISNKLNDFTNSNLTIRDRKRDKSNCNETSQFISKDHENKKSKLNNSLSAETEVNEHLEHERIKEKRQKCGMKGDECANSRLITPYEPKHKSRNSPTFKQMNSEQCLKQQLHDLENHKIQHLEDAEKNSITIAFTNTVSEVSQYNKSVLVSKHNDLQKRIRTERTCLQIKGHENILKDQYYEKNEEYLQGSMKQISCKEILNSKDELPRRIKENRQKCEGHERKLLNENKQIYSKEEMLLKKGNKHSKFKNQKRTENPISWDKQEPLWEIRSPTPEDKSVCSSIRSLSDHSLISNDKYRVTYNEVNEKIKTCKFKQVKKFKKTNVKNKKLTSSSDLKEESPENEKSVDYSSGNKIMDIAQDIKHSVSDLKENISVKMKSVNQNMQMADSEKNEMKTSQVKDEQTVQDKLQEKCELLSPNSVSHKEVNELHIINESGECNNLKHTMNENIHKIPLHKKTDTNMSVIWLRSDKKNIDNNKICQKECFKKQVNLISVETESICKKCEELPICESQIVSCICDVQSKEIEAKGKTQTTNEEQKVINKIQDVYGKLMNNDKSINVLQSTKEHKITKNVSEENKTGLHKTKLPFLSEIQKNSNTFQENGLPFSSKHLPFNSTAEPKTMESKKEEYLSTFPSCSSKIGYQSGDPLSHVQDKDSKLNETLVAQNQKLVKGSSEFSQPLEKSTLRRRTPYSIVYRIPPSSSQRENQYTLKKKVNTTPRSSTEVSNTFSLNETDFVISHALSDVALPAKDEKSNNFLSNDENNILKIDREIASNIYMNEKSFSIDHQSLNRKSNSKHLSEITRDHNSIRYLDTNTGLPLSSEKKEYLTIENVQYKYSSEIYEQNFTIRDNLPNNSHSTAKYNTQILKKEEVNVIQDIIANDKKIQNANNEFETSYKDIVEVISCPLQPIKMLQKDNTEMFPGCSKAKISPQIETDKGISHISTSLTISSSFTPEEKELICKENASNLNFTPIQNLLTSQKATENTTSKNITNPKKTQMLNEWQIVSNTSKENTLQNSLTETQDNEIIKLECETKTFSEDQVKDNYEINISNIDEIFGCQKVYGSTSLVHKPSFTSQTSKNDNVLMISESIKAKEIKSKKSHLLSNKVNTTQNSTKNKISKYQFHKDLFKKEILMKDGISTIKKAKIQKKIYSERNFKFLGRIVRAKLSPKIAFMQNKLPKSGLGTFSGILMIENNDVAQLCKERHPSTFKSTTEMKNYVNQKDEAQRYSNSTKQKSNFKVLLEKDINKIFFNSEMRKYSTPGTYHDNEDCENERKVTSLKEKEFCPEEEVNEKHNSIFQDGDESIYLKEKENQFQSMNFNKEREKTCKDEVGFSNTFSTSSHKMAALVDQEIHWEQKKNILMEMRSEKTKEILVDDTCLIIKKNNDPQSSKINLLENLSDTDIINNTSLQENLSMTPQELFVENEVHHTLKKHVTTPDKNFAKGVSDTMYETEIIDIVSTETSFSLKKSFNSENNDSKLINKTHSTATNQEEQFIKDPSFSNILPIEHKTKSSISLQDKQKENDNLNISKQKREVCLPRRENQQYEEDLESNLTQLFMSSDKIQSMYNEKHQNPIVPTELQSFISMTEDTLTSDYQSELENEETMTYQLKHASSVPSQETSHEQIDTYSTMRQTLLHIARTILNEKETQLIHNVENKHDLRKYRSLDDIPHTKVVALKHITRQLFTGELQPEEIISCHESIETRQSQILHTKKYQPFVKNVRSKRRDSNSVKANMIKEQLIPPKGEKPYSTKTSAQDKIKTLKQVIANILKGEQISHQIKQDVQYDSYDKNTIPKTKQTLLKIARIVLNEDISHNINISSQNTKKQKNGEYLKFEDIPSHQIEKLKQIAKELLLQELISQKCTSEHTALHSVRSNDSLTTQEEDDNIFPEVNAELSVKNFFFKSVKQPISETSINICSEGNAKKDLSINNESFKTKIKHIAGIFFSNFTVGAKENFLSESLQESKAVNLPTNRNIGMLEKVVRDSAFSVSKLLCENENKQNHVPPFLYKTLHPTTTSYHEPRKEDSYYREYIVAHMPSISVSPLSKHATPVESTNAQEQTLPHQGFAHIAAASYETLSCSHCSDTSNEEENVNLQKDEEASISHTNPVFSQGHAHIPNNTTQLLYQANTSNVNWPMSSQPGISSLEYNIPPHFQRTELLFPSDEYPLYVPPGITQFHSTNINNDEEEHINECYGTYQNPYPLSMMYNPQHLLPNIIESSTFGDDLLMRTESTISCPCNSIAEDRANNFAEQFILPENRDNIPSSIYKKPYVPCHNLAQEPTSQNESGRADLPPEVMNEINLAIRMRTLTPNQQTCQPCERFTPHQSHERPEYLESVKHIRARVRFPSGQMTPSFPLPEQVCTDVKEEEAKEIFKRAKGKKEDDDERIKEKEREEEERREEEDRVRRNKESKKEMERKERQRKEEKKRREEERRIEEERRNMRKQEEEEIEKERQQDEERRKKERKQRQEEMRQSEERRRDEKRKEEERRREYERRDDERRKKEREEEEEERKERERRREYERLENERKEEEDKRERERKRECERRDDERRENERKQEEEEREEMERRREYERREDERRENERKEEEEKRERESRREYERRENERREYERKQEEEKREREKRREYEMREDERRENERKKEEERKEMERRREYERREDERRENEREKEEEKRERERIREEEKRREEDRMEENRRKEIRRQEEIRREEQKLIEEEEQQFERMREEERIEKERRAEERRKEEIREKERKEKKKREDERREEERKEKEKREEEMREEEIREKRRKVEEMRWQEERRNKETIKNEMKRDEEEERQENGMNELERMLEEEKEDQSGEEEMRNEEEKRKDEQKTWEGEIKRKMERKDEERGKEEERRMNEKIKMKEERMEEHEGMQAEERSSEENRVQVKKERVKEEIGREKEKSLEEERREEEEKIKAVEKEKSKQKEKWKESNKLGEEKKENRRKEEIRKYEVLLDSTKNHREEEEKREEDWRNEDEKIKDDQRRGEMRRKKGRKGDERGKNEEKQTLKTIKEEERKEGKGKEEAEIKEVKINQEREQEAIQTELIPALVKESIHEIFKDASASEKQVISQLIEKFIKKVFANKKLKTSEQIPLSELIESFIGEIPAKYDVFLLTSLIENFIEKVIENEERLPSKRLSRPSLLHKYVQELHADRDNTPTDFFFTRGSENVTFKPEKKIKMSPIFNTHGERPSTLSQKEIPENLFLPSESASGSTNIQSLKPLTKSSLAEHFVQQVSKSIKMESEEKQRVSSLAENFIGKVSASLKKENSQHLNIPSLKSEFIEDISENLEIKPKKKKNIPPLIEKLTEDIISIENRKASLKLSEPLSIQSDTEPLNSEIISSLIEDFVQEVTKSIKIAPEEKQQVSSLVGNFISQLLTSLRKEQSAELNIPSMIKELIDKLSENVDIKPREIPTVISQLEILIDRIISIEKRKASETVLKSHLSDISQVDQVNFQAAEREEMKTQVLPFENGDNEEILIKLKISLPSTSSLDETSNEEEYEEEKRRERNIKPEKDVLEGDIKDDQVRIKVEDTRENFERGVSIKVKVSEQPESSLREILKENVTEHFGTKPSTHKIEKFVDKVSEKLDIVPVAREKMSSLIEKYVQKAHTSLNRSHSLRNEIIKKLKEEGICKQEDQTQEKETEKERHFEHTFIQNLIDEIIKCAFDLIHFPRKPPLAKPHPPQTKRQGKETPQTKRHGKETPQHRILDETQNKEPHHSPKPTPRTGHKIHRKNKVRGIASSLQLRLWWKILLILFILLLIVVIYLGAILGLSTCHSRSCSNEWPLFLRPLLLPHLRTHDSSIKLHGVF